MGYYNSSPRRQPVDNAIWAWLAGFSIMLIAVGLLMNAFDAADLRDTTTKIAALEPRRIELQTKYPTAEQEYLSKSPQFAKHWYEGFSQALSNAKTNLSPGGPVQTLAISAQKALDSGDRDTAKAIWSEADIKLQAAAQIIDRILGPPAFFSDLQNKSDAVDTGSFDKVQKVINTQKAYVASLSQSYSCGGVPCSMNYTSAYAVIGQAQSQLDNVAKRTLSTILPEGLVDKPLAFDQGEEAAKIANGASSTADSLLSSANNAGDEITACDSSISNAKHELSGAWNHDLAQSYYNKAVDEYNQAVSSCQARDFGSVSAHVSSCQSYASSSIDAAQPPTATPKPSNTPEPDTPEPSHGSSVSIGGDSSTGAGSSIDPVSDGDSNDYTDNSGSDNQDQSDGFGGSDNQDQSDGFGGTDSQDNTDGFGE